MMRVLRVLILGFFGGVFVTGLCPALAQPTSSVCSSVEQCVRVLSEYDLAKGGKPRGLNAEAVESALNNLPLFGEAGLYALLALLEHNIPEVRDRAGYALGAFTPLSSEHLSTLMKAHQNGVKWLERSIADIRTDEALAYLWREFLDDPNESSNYQTVYGLSKFDDRLVPLAKAGMRRCVAEKNIELCVGIWELMAKQDEPTDYVVDGFVTFYNNTQPSDDAHWTLVYHLQSIQHPAVLDYLIDQTIKATSLLPNEFKADWRYPVPEDQVGKIAEYWLPFAFHFEMLEQYGRNAARVEPTLLALLDRDAVPFQKSEALHALARIGDAQTAAQLMKFTDRIKGDYAFTYNLAEALALLGATQAKPFLQELADDHWFYPVRMNAQRGLRYMAEGGNFYADQRIEPSRIVDGEIIVGRGNKYLTSPLELAYDFLAADFVCRPELGVAYEQYRPSNMKWPDLGGDPVWLEFQQLGTAEFRRVRRKAAPIIRELDGELNFYAEVGNYEFYGFDAGEWGGAVYMRDDQGRTKPFIDGNAKWLLKKGKRLFFIFGNGHMGMSYGHVEIVDIMPRGPKRISSIQLPVDPDYVGLLSEDVIAIYTDAGDFVMRTDGEILDPRDYADCNKVKHGGWVTPSGTPCGDLEGCIKKAGEEAPFIYRGRR